MTATELRHPHAAAAASTAPGGQSAAETADTEPKLPWYARPIGGSRGKAAAGAARPGRTVRAAADKLIVGGEPRVDLLPPEVKAQRKAAGMRRRLVLAVVAVALLAIAGTLGARAFAGQSAERLSAAQSDAARLLAQQRSYRDVVGVQNDVALAAAAQQVGGSTEIDWQAYLDQIQGTLPSGVTITSVSVDSSSPLAAYAQPTVPLQGARVASITFSALSSSIPQVPEWLVALRALPGAADALPGSVSYDTTSHSYTATVTMHVNAAAFDHRFAAKGK